MADKITAETIKQYIYSEDYYTKIDIPNVESRIKKNSGVLSNGTMTRLQMLNMFPEFMTFSELSGFATKHCPNVKIKYLPQQILKSIYHCDSDKKKVHHVLEICGSKFEWLGERFALTYFTGPKMMQDIEYNNFINKMRDVAKDLGIIDACKKPLAKKQRVCEDIQLVVSVPKSVPIDDSEDYKIAYEWKEICIMNTMFDFLDDDCPIVHL